MLLAIDIGNTNITLGAYDNDFLALTARLTTERHYTGDQYAVTIKEILALNGLDFTCVEDCIISSVVPTVSVAVSDAVSKLFHVVPMVLGPGIKTGLNIKIDNPAQLGADFVAGAVGAIAEYTLPCIVIDMGTATTISVIDKDGCFLGGCIAAGVKLTLNALCEKTSLLPLINLESPRSAIGKNTADCMKSGIVLGAASMLDGLIDRFEEELGETATIVATGGISGEIINHCKRNIIYNENLLLEGLREIYNKNH